MTAFPRPTVRVRLTLLYGGLFLVAGAALLFVTYLLVRFNLEQQPAAAAGGGIVAGHGVGGVALALPAPDEVITGATAQQLLAQQDQRVRAATLRSIVTQGALALVMVALLAVAFGYVLAERFLRPLHRITETAHRVSRGGLVVAPAERIGLQGPADEIKDLADTFDEMLERLAETFDSQRRFAANASHELRTPLAINRTMIEVALRRREASEDARRLGESLLLVNARQERLIDGLLTLAKGEHVVVARTPVDLRDVARHVLAQAAEEAAGAGLRVTADLHPAPTAGESVLIERLAQNLVENAVRHNRDGGQVSVSTGRGPAGEARLTVVNTGASIPPYEVESLFEPFRRLQVDRIGSDRGAGLGLSIVRAVARSHGGEVTAEPGDDGGLRVTVVLPAVARPA